MLFIHWQQLVSCFFFFYCCDIVLPKDQSPVSRTCNNCFTAECNSRPDTFCSLQPPAHINTHAYIQNFMNFLKTGSMYVVLMSLNSFCSLGWPWTQRPISLLSAGIKSMSPWLAEIKFKNFLFIFVSFCTWVRCLWRSEASSQQIPWL